MSAQVTITQLPTAGTITGTEAVPIVQNGVTVQTTAAALVGSPIQTQTFITVSNEPTLANSRYLGATNGLTLSASSPQGVLNVTTTGALSSLVSTGAGIQAKSDSTTVVSRTITAGSAGLTITNGNGASGNPTITLSDPLPAFATAGVLAVAYGGTGVTSSTGTNKVVLSTAPTFDTTVNFTPQTAPSYSQGLLWYDSDQKALAYYNDATNNAVHIGQETIVKVVNNTGSTIPFGAAVYITSTATGYSYPGIALAQANNIATAAVIGLTNTAIASGAIGYVVAAGMVNGINTASFNNGDVLYLSPYSAGQVMNTVPPTGYTVQVGVCAYGHASLGSIYTKQTTPLSISANIVSVGQLAIANGGTAGATKAAGFNNLSPITSTGDLIIGNGTNSATRLAIGSNTYILTSNGTTATWSAPPTSISYPGAGIANSTGSAWDTSYTTSGSGTVVALATGATLTTPTLTSPNISTIVNTGTLTLPTTTDTLVGRITTDTLLNKTLTTPILTNPTITNYTETRFSATASGGVITLNLTNGTFQTITTVAGTNAINLPTPTSGKSLTVQIFYNATPTSLTFYTPSGSLKYPTSTTPSPTLTNGKYDFYSFISDGTNWYGVQTGANF
jgi:hypothetical protein